jgi:phage protein U
VSFEKSFQVYGNIPSALISDGLVTVPLWAVTSMTVDETYVLPAIGSSTARSIVSTHDDTITLLGVLIGYERFAWKLALEQLADVSRRGSALAAFTSGKVGGLILVTSMTIRTDIQIQNLVFVASATKRETLDVTIKMAHLPLPGSLGKLLDVASLAVGGLTDWKGGK